MAAWFYTGGSQPYGYLALGEVMVFVFFGLVAVIGTTYVQTGVLRLPRLYAAIGIGALACAILVANNLRDIPTDREVGKRTLAVVLGDDRTRYLYALLRRPPPRRARRRRAHHLVGAARAGVPAPVPSPRSGPCSAARRAAPWSRCSQQTGARGAALRGRGVRRAARLTAA